MRSWNCSQIKNEEEEEQSINWRRFWNEEGWTEAPFSWRLCKMHLSYLCMNVCPMEYGCMVKKKMKVLGWSMEEPKEKLSIAVSGGRYRRSQQVERCERE